MKPARLEDAKASSAPRFSLAVIAATLAACGNSPSGRSDAGMPASGDSGVTSDAGPPNDGGRLEGPHVASGVPTPFTTTEPGYLHVGPPGLLVARMATRTLEVTLYDSTGAVIDQAPPVSFESADATVATVSSSGVVTGVGTGFTDIVVTSATHGVRTLTVGVATPTATPRGVRFSVPIATIPVGESMAVAYTVVDGTGNEVPGTRVTLRSIDGDGVAVEGNTIRAVAPGLYSIAGIIDLAGGIALDGRLSVAVTPRALPSTPETRVIACNLVAPPFQFYGPGLSSAPLRLEIIESDGRAGWNRRQAAPTEVVVLDNRVARLGGNSITSIAAGTTRYQVYYGDVLCTCESVHVYPDLNGVWGGKCSNGDHGTLTLGAWPRKVVSRRTGASVPSIYPNLTFARGEGCFSNTTEMFGCAANATLVADWGGAQCFRETNLGPCSPETPCGSSLTGGVSVTHCAYDRHVPMEALLRNAQFIGPDTFVLRECTFERNRPETCDVGTVVSTATFDGVPIQGMSMLVNASGFLTLTHGAATVTFQGPVTVGSYPIRGLLSCGARCVYGLVEAAGVGHGVSCIGDKYVGTAEITEHDEAKEVVAGRYDFVVYEQIGIPTCGVDPQHRLAGEFRGSYTLRF